MARFCKHCGAQLSDNAKFCKNCGQAVSAPASNNTQTVYQTPVQNVQMSVNGVCPNCGSQIRPGAKFCRVCGMTASINMYPINNARDKTIPIKVALGFVCAALFIIGALSIPGNIKAARFGSDAGWFSSANMPSFDYEEFGTLSEQQKDEYRLIDEMAENGQFDDHTSKPMYLHDNYEWIAIEGNSLNEDNGNGENDY